MLIELTLSQLLRIRLSYTSPEEVPVPALLKVCIAEFFDKVQIFTNSLGFVGMWGRSISRASKAKRSSRNEY
jgi:hypothetical protein